MNKFGFNCAFTLSLLIGSFTFLLLFLAQTYLVAIISRSIFCKCALHFAFFIKPLFTDLTNQSPNLCALYLMQHENDANLKRSKTFMYISRVFGLVIGPIIGGVLLGTYHGLKIIAFIATFISALSTGRYKIL